MKAVGDAGLKARFATAFLDQPGNIAAMPGSVALGHYVAHTFNVELAKGDFVERYQKFSGHVPSYIEPQAVNALRMMLTAAQSVDSGGGEIEATTIAEAIGEDLAADRHRDDHFPQGRPSGAPAGRGPTAALQFVLL